MEKKCAICNVKLVEKKHKKYGKDMKHISRHHLYPKRFKNPKRAIKSYPSDADIIKIFGITSDKPREFCYECHEEILHNLVLNEPMVRKLGLLLRNKNKIEKIKIFHEVFKLGLEGYRKKIIR